MGWSVRFSATAGKQLKKLDTKWQSAILDYLEDRVAPEPKKFGKALIGDKAGMWRYRVGDYRIICEMLDQQATIHVLKIGHRKDVYN
ncbi:MAG: type II toxin-antitoxin system RelE/ParE family toxin [Nitrospinae bacterium]|nr:type II toxin-antitoxin system RelE/ParE family toxin [Nitrospinota bacterium]